MKKFILPAAISALVSSFTLWLVDHPIKYIFFALQVTVTLVLAWLFIYPRSKMLESFTAIRRIDLHSRTRVSRLDCLFVLISASLLLMNIFGIFLQINLILAFVTVSLLPGYFLLRLTNVFNSIPHLEVLGLSYALSLALGGILPNFFMPLANQSNRMVFLSLLTFLSVIPILKDILIRHAVDEQETRLEFSFIQLLTLTIIIVFFFVVITFLYPQMSLVPDHDIVRDFAGARLWALSPESFSSQYPFFQIYEAAIYSVSNPPLEAYQTFAAIASIGVLLSFYIMAKKYLEKIDRRLPLVATAFWTFFSGFGWVYIFVKKLGYPDTTQMSLLRAAYDATYADIGYGVSTNLWLYGFIAMTASFCVFFVLLYLIKCKNINTPSLILLATILVMALYFIHASELIMFVLLLIVLASLDLKSVLRVDEILYSTFFGILGAIAFSYLMPKTSPVFSTTYSPLLALICPVALMCLVRRLGWRGIDVRRFTHVLRISAYILMIFFLAGLLGWFPLSQDFSMEYVSGAFVVPWFFHPVRLGIVGFLGLLGILVIATRYREDALLVFPFLFLLAWIAGRAISFINTDFFQTGYWEWRFIFFSFAAASVTSAVMLKHADFQRIMPKESLRRACICSLMIGLLVLGGVSSTFLTIENMVLGTDNGYRLDESELRAISFLSSAFAKEKPAPLLTVTYQSADALEFVPSPWVDKSIQSIIWSPKCPEIPLTFMNNRRFQPPYIYLDQRDLDAIYSSKLRGGYVASFLLKTMTEVYNHSNTIILKASEGVPPLQNGGSALVISSKENTFASLLAGYILSLGGCNYTTILDSDPGISEKKTLILPSDSITSNDVANLGLDKGKIVVLNLDGYGSLSRLFFDNRREREVSISVESGEGVFIKPLTGTTESSKAIREHLFEGKMEFTITNEAENGIYVPIAGDNQTAFWTLVGGVGQGDISAPFLTNDSVTKEEGNDSLKITVEKGSYNNWFMEHSFVTNQDWSNKDFISLWWYGVDSGQTLGILMLCPYRNNYYCYTFVEDFNGWRHIVVPLKAFTPYGEPEWDSVNALQIRSFNGGVAGERHLDSIGLDRSIDASVELTVYNATEELPKLSVFDGSSYVPLEMPQINSSTQIPASGLYFLNGLSAQRVFAESQAGEIRLEKVDDIYKITLSLKIPPKNGGLSQLRFRIDYENEREKMEATHIMISDKEIPLPSKVKLVPLVQKEGVKVLSWYVEGSRRGPLAVMQEFGDHMQVVYLNVYPLIGSDFAWAGSSQGLSRILASLFDTLGLPKYDMSVTSWVIGDSNPVFAFEEGTLEGNVSIQADSIVFDDLNLPVVYVSVNSSHILCQNVVSLSIHNVGGKIVLSSEDVRIGSGKGFYTFINASNPEIEISGDEILISALTSNGTCVNVESSAKARLSTEGSLSSYVRTPSIHIIGEASFKKVYAFHSYLEQLKTMGQNLFIKGEIQFDMPLSDEYNLGSNFVSNGIATRDPPVLKWNEIESLTESPPYLFFAAVVFSVLWISRRTTGRRRFSLRVSRLKRTEN